MSQQPYSITYKPSAATALRKLDRQHQRAIVTAIDALAYEPRPHGAKNLQGGDGEYRIRVASHREVYDIKDSELVTLVLYSGHRKEIYQTL